MFMCRFITSNYVQLAALLLLSSCGVRNATHFSSADNFNNIKATVTLDDNSQIAGYLTLRKNNMGSHASIWQPANKTNEPVNVADITGFSTDLGTFYFKVLHPSAAGKLNGSKPFGAFVKLISSPGDAISLYEYTEYTPGIKSSLPNAVRHYYIQLPGENEKHIWDIEGEKLNPHFNDMTKKIFAGDAALVQKIENKERGFYYKPFSFSSSDKLKILMNLINEYSQQNLSPSIAAD